MSSHRRLALILVVLLTASCQSGPLGSSSAAPSAAGASAGLLFDDFAYDSTEQLTAHGWILRAQPGWPGADGATWAAAGVSLARSAQEQPEATSTPGGSDDRVVRLTATTDGTAAGTYQAQLCYGRKFLEGTYAARIRFTGDPLSGLDGDTVVQSFYAISPLLRDLDPDYSELDFEYTPNGAWGMSGPTLFVNSWETFGRLPWRQDNEPAWRPGELVGWHVLVLQVADGAIRYYLDGSLLAEHGGRVYPESAMAIAWNLWFVSGGLSAVRA